MEEPNASQDGPGHNSTTSPVTAPTAQSFPPIPTIPTFRVRDVPIPYQPNSSPTPTRGRGLTETDKRDLIQTCINNQELYRNGTKQAFWQLVSDQFSATNRHYANYSCQRSVQAMIEKRRAESRVVETGETQESNPQLNLVLDRWIGIEDEINQHREDNRRVSRRRVANLQNAYNHRANLISGMSRSGNNEAIEIAPSIPQTPDEISPTLIPNIASDSASNNMASNPSSSTASNLDSTEMQRRRGRAAIQTEADLAFIRFVDWNMAQSSQVQAQVQSSQSTQLDPLLLERLESLENQQQELSHKLESLDEIKGQLSTLLTRLNQ